MKRTILITGSSSGIGKASARLFQRAGWNVIATMRSPEKETELSALPNVLVARLDVQDSASIAAAVSAGIEGFGRIDVLLNNAGYGAYGLLEATPMEKISRQFDVNVIGLLETTKDLVLAIDRAGAGPRHPRRYAQVFQALRMWVNDEREELEAALAWLPDAIRPGGVVVTLAYHSGEDRSIKQTLRGARMTRPMRRLPDRPGLRPPEGPWDELTRRVVTPSNAEKDRNPRARSARLRAFRRKSP